MIYEAITEYHMQEIKRLREIIRETDNPTMLVRFVRNVWNIPPDIIERTWPASKHGTLTDHFKAKYHGCCVKQGYASPSAIFEFMCELSDHNLKAFVKKVLYANEPAA